MEATKKKCLQCRSAFLVQRNPRQQYCSRPACQKNRQNKWRQQKRQHDRDYETINALLTNGGEKRTLIIGGTIGKPMPILWLKIENASVNGINSYEPTRPSKQRIAILQIATR